MSYSLSENVIPGWASVDLAKDMQNQPIVESFKLGLLLNLRADLKEFITKLAFCRIIHHRFSEVFLLKMWGRGHHPLTLQSSQVYLQLDIQTLMQIIIYKLIY